MKISKASLYAILIAAILGEYAVTRDWGQTGIVAAMLTGVLVFGDDLAHHGPSTTPLHGLQFLDELWAYCSPRTIVQSKAVDTILARTILLILLLPTILLWHLMRWMMRPGA